MKSPREDARSATIPPRRMGGPSEKEMTSPVEELAFAVPSSQGRGGYCSRPVGR